MASFHFVYNLLWGGLIMIPFQAEVPSVSHYWF